MLQLSSKQRLLCLFASIFLGGSQISVVAAPSSQNQEYHTPGNCQNSATNFLVMAGGGSPRNNEIALEKNVLYFQRTLQTLGYNPATANLFFANGNDGQATIRYIDDSREQKFKVPNIPNLQGAATLDNFKRWIATTASRQPQNPVFFYFTGHGIPDALILWKNQQLTVQQLAQQLDQLPQNTPVVTMMAQCFSGSFADFIYEGGDDTQPIALQTRCGFFATVSTRPSVGCTPEVNEADYKDYSSSFFAGLSGVSRTGEVVASADYNGDRQISYAEAHAFAKVDEATMDRPVSTVEVWLQKQARKSDVVSFLEQPLTQLISQSRPEQQYVVSNLAQKFDFNLQQSYRTNVDRLRPNQVSSDVQQAYLVRLAMELINIGMEEKIRSQKDKKKIAILERLIKCEASYWQQ